MNKVLLLICFLFVCNVLAQNMIADIKEPVKTDFGIYIPVPVIVTPQATLCDPGDNLENVVNLSDFHFSESAYKMLQKNHFVVMPALQKNSSTAYNEMFDIYNECRESGIPQFITTDAVLHGFHLLFDFILRTCEEKSFIEQLETLLDNLFDRQSELYSRVLDPDVKESLFINLDYLLVALQLLNPKVFEQDPLPGGKYNKELDLINQATQQLVESPIFAYPEDYTQYKPRGHYTRTEELQRYFRSMMWLGRMTFSCEDDSQQSQRYTLSAILLAQSVLQVLDQKNNTGLEFWENIYQPTIFFVGKSDDINFLNYLPLCYEIYGKSFASYSIDRFSDRDKMFAFLKASEKFEPAAITYPGQPKKGFRFMGQRFIPDSWILDELVFSKIPNRLLPTGLDVMMVLGSEKSAQQEHFFQYLSERDKNDSFYLEKLNFLKQLFRSYPSETWAQNIYWNWLYCFMPLLFPKGEGFPYFMQTEAWQDKELLTALASWAELRHDTILYAKQSGTERGLPPSSTEVQGYVEPNPYVYARIAGLVKYMVAGLENKNLLFEEFKTHLGMFSDLVLQLKDISEKELTNVPLSSQDYISIFNFGKTLFDIMTFQPYVPSEGPAKGDNQLEPMPVIADVHYEANSGTVLEEAVGYPYVVYVICNIEGEAVITKGAGFSYYEFVQPADNRLSDEEWRDMLLKSPGPEPPRWTESFLENFVSVNSADFFYWEKPGSMTVQLEFSKNKYVVKDTVAFVVLTDDIWASDSPIIKITSPEGTNFAPTKLFKMPQQNGWQVMLATEDFIPGLYFIDINKGGGENKIHYRTQFYLHNNSIINNPENNPACSFILYQNYPNPFNPKTVISFELFEDVFVSIDIFDVNGKKVRQLVSQFLKSGLHSRVWNGTDDDGKKLSSGLYYYRLKANRLGDVKRMILLR